jgi:hypothetical protein
MMRFHGGMNKNHGQNGCDRKAAINPMGHKSAKDLEIE